MRKKLDYDYCSASPILEWLGDKWALVVLLKLHENGVIRFNELYKTIPSISEKMLSTVLRSLVTDGLVGRKIYPSVPPKVEYYVSEFGETLIPHLEQLKQCTHYFWIMQTVENKHSKVSARCKLYI